MEHVEAAGEIVTGSMLARAAEPHAGETPQGHSRTCLNCGAALAAHFCGHCGQSGHLHRTLGSLLHDLAHGVLHFEGKIWRTLPMLAWRPGDLTRRYIRGERARFVSPLALFLFTAFMMFAIVSNLPLVPETPFGNGRSRVDGARELVRDQIADLQEERNRLAAQGPAIRRADQTIARLRKDLVILEEARERLSTVGPTLTMANREVKGEDGDVDWINTRWRQAKRNPDLLVYKLKNSAYKFSWVLVPITLPLIWLLFARRRDVGLYDHAIFGIYSLSFMSVLTIAAALLISAGAGFAAALMMMLVPPLHMFRQLRGAYALSWSAALWRTVALMFMTAAALLTWIVILMIVGSG